jgi:eukaryotic-like serine/threonine-protein kinase
MLKLYQRADIYFDPTQEIGSDGKSSKTYIAHDSQLDAEIVIKQLAKAKLTYAPSFFEEAKCLYAGAHPNVVQIYYACQDNDFVYIARPYYKRGSIKGLINSKYMMVREIISAACQIVSALHNIHSKGLIHFDVKPDNVLLSDRGEALLSDFGLARPTVGGLAHPGFFYGKMIPPNLDSPSTECATAMGSLIGSLQTL